MHGATFLETYMSIRASHLLRRRFLTASLGAALFLRPGAGRAALSGVETLDTPSLMVNRPACVLLEAICAAGGRLVAVGEHGVIVYSDDHGASWTQASVPTDVTLTCVGFASPLIGWAAGHYGVILKTIDGGKTWAMQLNGIQAAQLSLAAAQAAVADHSTSAGAPLALHRASIFVGAGPSLPFLTLLVLDADNAIAFGAYRMVMRTRDGGASWADQSLSIDDRLSNTLYSAVKCASGIYIAGEAGLVFRSTDGGNNFPQVTSPSATTLFGILSAADGSLVVFGVASAVFRSTDTGNSWTPSALTAPDDLVAGHVLKSGKILIATGSGFLYASRDNGATFTQVHGIPQISILDITELDDGSLVFVGFKGVSKYPATIIS